MLFDKKDLGFMPNQDRQGNDMSQMFLEFKKQMPNARALFDLFGGGSVSWHGLARSLDSLDRLQRLQRLESLKYHQSDIHKISLSNSSYLDFDFAKISKELDLKPDEIIIYCDIPYQDKKSQSTYKGIYHWDKCLKKHKNSFREVIYLNNKGVLNEV